MNAKQNSKVPYNLLTKKRKQNDFINLYVVIDGKRFELVPHCRTKKEVAYFYSMLKKTELYEGD